MMMVIDQVEADRGASAIGGRTRTPDFLSAGCTRCSTQHDALNRSGYIMLGFRTYLGEVLPVELPLAHGNSLRSSDGMI